LAFRRADLRPPEAASVMDDSAAGGAGPDSREGLGAAGAGAGFTGVGGGGDGGIGVGALSGATGAGDGGAPAWWWAVSWAGGEAAGRAGIGTNSPGFHVWGIRSTDGSFRNRSACPQARQRRVPIDSSPRARSESEPPPMEPVFSSFAQTKSDAPQFEQTGGTRSPLPSVSRPLGKRLACTRRSGSGLERVRNGDVIAEARGPDGTS
jgi:hypothetical protein